MESTIVKMSFFGGEWGLRPGAITFTDIPLCIRPYKRPIVSNGKNCRCTFPSGALPLASHSPHTFKGMQARTHMLPPWSLPLIWWREEEDGVRRRSFFTVIMLFFLCHKMNWERVETGEAEWAMPFHSKQRHQTKWHVIFIGPLQMFLLCMFTLCIIQWWVFCIGVMVRITGATL